MRLLSTQTNEIREFISDEDAPRYAILSHTWTNHEVSLQEWRTMEHTMALNTMESRSGYVKIKISRRQAALDGLEWIWIDR